MHADKTDNALFENILQSVVSRENITVATYVQQLPHWMRWGPRLIDLTTIVHSYQTFAPK